MIRGAHRSGQIMALLLSATVAMAVADDYKIDWWTVDGGGDMWTTGGDFELSGTIGQPDAGGPMTGGDFELVGGFWSAPAGPALCAGDLNCDGIVDYDDIDPFVAALSCVGGDPNCWPAPSIPADCPWLNGDCDGDGNVTYSDIDPFVARIGATCP